MSELPVLYSFRRCPYAMRARMALAASGIEVELREIILRDKPAHMLALSAKGTVPVLWLAQSHVIDESREVMAWALVQNDPFDWLTRVDEPRIDAFDARFKHHLDRYKYATRYADEVDNVLLHRAACHEMLRQVEQDLTSDWLGGEHAGLTDVAILPFVRQFRIADSAWFDNELGLPRVHAWLHRFLVWPVFVAVMDKYALWQSETTGVRFRPKIEDR